MSIVEFLSQPLWQRLGLTLVHFLWQGLAVAVLVGALVRVLRLKRGNARYAAYLPAFAAMIVCPVVTFTAIDIGTSPNAELVIEAESTEVIDSSPYTALPAGDILPEAEIPISAIPASENSIPLSQRISAWLNVSMPWVLVIWMVGVIVLSVRLLMGFVGVYRWRHNLEPLPERLARRIASLSDGLGMRGFSRVFISPTVLQAMAVGYLRPMVLLPAAMLTQMQPEMLEAVIAHELAHIRRFDLWVNLAQRVTETLLFYHPAVWWLSNCLRNERELCCDELAVKATGERVTYASTLESVGRSGFMAKQPVLAAGLAHDNKPTLHRVRHILGLTPAQRNCPFWLAGIIAVVFLAAIVIPTTLALTNQSDENLTDYENAVVEGIGANRDKFECGYLAWSSKRFSKLFEDRGRPATDLAGQYELWWDGKKMATKYVQDQVYEDPEGHYSVKKQQGGDSYDGGVLSWKPDFRDDNWLGPHFTRWRGLGSQDRLIRLYRKQKNSSKDWSVVDNNGVKIIRFTTRVINQTDREYGAYSIRDYDPSKGYGLVNEEWYNPDGTRRMKHTVKLQEVIPGGWFPVEVDFKHFAITDGHLFGHNHYALDIERCSFNDKSALPARVFKGAIDKQLKYQEKLQKYLAMELKGLSRVKEIDKTDKVKRGARQAIEIFITAAMAGDLEQAAEYAHPNRLPASQIADLAEIAKGQNLWIMAVLADDSSAIAVSSVIRGDHNRTGPLVFFLDRAPQDGRDNWWVHDIDMETPDSAEGELKRFLEKHPKAQKVPPEQKPDVQVEGEETQNANFTATLPNEVTVELLGVCEHPSEGKQWWRPDGTLLDQAPYEKIEDRFLKNYEQVIFGQFPNDLRREFAFRLIDISETETKIKKHILRSNRSILGRKALINGTPVANLKAIVASIPIEDNTVRVDIGVATGAWQTVAEGLPDRDNSFTTLQGQGSFYDIHEQNGNISLRSADTFADFDYRVVAIDNYGVTHASETMILCSTTMRKRITMVAFKNISLEAVKEFQFQTRPYEWITFKNVSLRPGVKTEVEVVKPDVQVETEEGWGEHPEAKEVKLNNPAVQVEGTVVNRVEGRVVDLGGSPIIGAAVQWILAGERDKNLYLFDDEPRRGEKNIVLTDAQGRFAFEISGTEDFGVHVKANGFAQKLMVNLDFPIDAEKLKVIMLLPESRVFGKVVKDGKAVPDASVSASIFIKQLQEMLSSPWPDMSVHTDENGYYSIAGLPAGELSISVNSSLAKGNLNMFQKTVQLEQGQEVQLNFGDEIGFALTGIVAVAGKPVEVASVSVRSTDGHLTKWDWTNSKGEFRITGIPEGDYRIFTDYSTGLDPKTFLWSPGENYMKSQKISVNGDLTIRIDLSDTKPDVQVEGEKTDQVNKTTDRQEKAQVAIEARFLLVDENFIEDVGLNLKDLDTDKLPKATVYTGTPTEGKTTEEPLKMDIIDDLQVDFLIRATQGYKNARLLTAPKILVLDGEQYECAITKEIDYVASFTEPNDPSQPSEPKTDTFIKGIQLKVLPKITSDKKYILLDLDLKMSSLLGWQEYVQKDKYHCKLPIIERTTIDARVAVADKGTVLLGGMKITPVDWSQPTGDAAISEAKDKQILLFLVKPTIVPPREPESDAKEVIRGDGERSRRYTGG